MMRFVTTTTIDKTHTNYFTRASLPYDVLCIDCSILFCIDKYDGWRAFHIQAVTGLVGSDGVAGNCDPRDNLVRACCSQVRAPVQGSPTLRANVAKGHGRVHSAWFCGDLYHSSHPKRARGVAEFD